jgi:hypothetical protein
MPKQNIAAPNGLQRILKTTLVISGMPLENVTVTGADLRFEKARVRVTEPF